MTVHKDTQNPLLLVSNGRSGTTLLMGYLSSHPGIVTNTDYPMEKRVAQYYAHLACVLLDQETDNTSQHVRAIIEGMPWATANPYPDTLDPAWISNEYQPRLMSLLKDAILQVYSEESRRQEKTAAFFVEKSHPISKARFALKTMFSGYREIYLVRDPRAVISSILNFNQKRGFDGFGITRYKSPKEYVELFVRDYTAFRKSVENGEGQCILVRYEDLVISPVESLARLFQQLGITSDDATLQDIIETSSSESRKYAESHSTTSSAVDSVTAWEKSLPREYREAIEDRMGHLLDYFNYANG